RAAAGHRLQHRLAERLDEARLRDDPRGRDQPGDLVVPDPAEQPDSGAAFELGTKRAVAGEREHSLTEAGERVCQADDVLALGEGADTEERGCAVRRRPEREAVEVDARIDDVGLPARL